MAPRRGGSSRGGSSSSSSSSVQVEFGGLDWDAYTIALVVVTGLCLLVAAVFFLLSFIGAKRTATGKSFFKSLSKWLLMPNATFSLFALFALSVSDYALQTTSISTSVNYLIVYIFTNLFQYIVYVVILFAGLTTVVAQMRNRQVSKAPLVAVQAVGYGGAAILTILYIAAFGVWTAYYATAIEAVKDSSSGRYSGLSVSEASGYGDLPLVSSGNSLELASSALYFVWSIFFLIAACFFSGAGNTGQKSVRGLLIAAAACLFIDRLLLLAYRAAIRTWIYDTNDDIRRLVDFRTAVIALDTIFVTIILALFVVSDMRGGRQTQDFAAPVDTYHPGANAEQKVPAVAVHQNGQPWQYPAGAVAHSEPAAYSSGETQYPAVAIPQPHSPPQGWNAQPQTNGWTGAQPQQRGPTETSSSPPSSVSPVQQYTPYSPPELPGSRQ